MFSTFFIRKMNKISLKCDGRDYHNASTIVFWPRVASRWNGPFHVNLKLSTLRLKEISVSYFIEEIICQSKFIT